MSFWQRLTYLFRGYPMIDTSKLTKALSDLSATGQRVGVELTALREEIASSPAVQKAVDQATAAVVAVNADLLKTVESSPPAVA